NLLKDSTRELKAFAKLCARRFACEADAQAELSCFTASLMLLQLDAEVVGEPVYTGRGRPKRGEEPIGHQFQITGLAATSLACVEEARNQTGVFILATNDHSDTLTMAELLATY
ncbi:IS1634 family transposase, partial [Klebsiella pneumoniae]|nr:IS1634 family transposase [Klebsiella pneumoniae]